jgi:hypothetical protein
MMVHAKPAPHLVLLVRIQKPALHVQRDTSKILPVFLLAQVVTMATKTTSNAQLVTRHAHNALEVLLVNVKVATADSYLRIRPANRDVLQASTSAMANA